MKSFVAKLLVCNSILWLASLILIDLWIVDSLLLFAFYILVPLALYVTETKDREGKVFLTYKLTLYLIPIMAILTSISYLFPQGTGAGLLSLGWLFITLLVSLYGILRFLARGPYYIEEIAIDVGLIYLVVGGVWFSLHRFGAPVLHFDPIIIQLTAIHFHYSAFIAPLFIGLLGRILRREGKLSKTYYIIAIGIMLGQIGVAFGITYSRVYEFIFVLLFVLSLYGYCYYSLFTIRKYVTSKLAKLLLLLSSSSLVITMFLAFYYALGRVLYIPLITIPDMVLLHGVGNAFGFVFLGLVAWIIISPSMYNNLYSIPHSNLSSGWRVGASFFDNEAKDEKITGLIDDMLIYQREDLQIEKIHPSIRLFYEQTELFSLYANIEWGRGFRIFSYLYHWLSSRLEQIHLSPHLHKVEMHSKIKAVHSKRDSRERIRAWIRTSASSGKAIFVAAYSFHKYKNSVYMNIALPLPYGNMTGILRLDHHTYNHAQDGLMLSSYSSHKREKGDEGIYYFSKYLSFRLPLNERFIIEAVQNKEDSLLAHHEMWIFGLKFLTVKYEIKQK